MTNKSTLRAPSFHNDIPKDQHHSMTSEPSPHGELDRQRKLPEFEDSLILNLPDFFRDGAATGVLNILDKPRDLLRKLLSTYFVMSGASLIIEQNFEESRPYAGQEPNSIF